MFKTLVTMVNSKQPSTRSKSTQKQPYEQDKHSSFQDKHPTSRKEINED